MPQNAGVLTKPMVWSTAIQDNCLFLEFGVATGKDKSNISIFVQKSKISLAEQHTSSIDVDDCANYMIREVRCKKYYRSGDVLGPRHTAAWNELVY
jgi:hypothetical protein